MQQKVKKMQKNKEMNKNEMVFCGKIEKLSVWVIFALQDVFFVYIL